MTETQMTVIWGKQSKMILGEKENFFCSSVFWAFEKNCDEIQL